MSGIEWRDVINLVGFSITIASLWLAFRQIRKTTTAAEAARDAAERMLRQNREQYRRYVASNLRRYLAELRMLVDREVWDRAASRFDDLAEQLSQLGAASRESDLAASAEATTAARQWAITCRRMIFRKSRFARTKFDNYIQQLHGTIDAYCGPFVNGKEEDET
jgi:hypothetical protein